MNTCCCNRCKNTATLWKVDASGTVVLAINHYADFGAVPTLGTAPHQYKVYTGIGVIPTLAAMDAAGNIYQSGGPSIPVDPVVANTQDPIDSVRAYDSDGNKLWGWSAWPTGVIFSGTRLRPFILESFDVSGDGLVVAHAQVAFFETSYTFYGVRDGATVWTIALPGVPWTNVVAGTTRVVMRHNSLNPYGSAANEVYNGIGGRVYDADGNYLGEIALWSARGGLPGDQFNATSGYIAVDRDDVAYAAWNSDNWEKYYGSAQLARFPLASGSSTQPNGTAHGYDCFVEDWVVQLAYIRTVGKVSTDGTYICVTGARFIDSFYSDDGNFSYGDTLFVTEIRLCSDGSLVQVLFQSGTIFDLSNTPFQNHSDAPVQIGNKWITYNNEIFEHSDDHTSPAEKLIARWKVRPPSWPIRCYGFRSDGSSVWGCDVAPCDEKLTYNPDCSGTAIWTSESDGLGGFRWVEPTDGCAGSCQPVRPDGVPTSLYDTFEAECVSIGISQGCESRFVNVVDFSDSSPEVGVPPEDRQFTQWAPDPDFDSDCEGFHYPRPSFRPEETHGFPDNLPTDFFTIGGEP